MIARFRKEFCAALILTLLAGCQRGEQRGTQEKSVREVGDSSTGGRRSRTVNVSSSTCRESAVDAVLDSNAVEWERDLVGSYDLTVVENILAGAQSTIRGRLVLNIPDSTRRVLVLHKDLPSQGVRVLLVGWSDAKFDASMRVSLAHSPASNDPDRPGVQMITPGMLMFGNSIGRHGTATDSGVLFEVLKVDRTGLSGRWADAGLRTPLPGGYFCAVRIG